MAVVYQAINSAQSGTASVNVSWPVGHVADDIGILVLESNSAAWSTPSGWTLVASSAITVTELNIYWKRAASSAEAAVATGFPATLADHVVARIHTFRGCVTTGTPILTSATSTKALASTSWSAPSITTTTADEFVVYGVSRSDDSVSTLSFSAPTNANLVSPTEIIESGTLAGNGGGFVLGYGVKTTAGATGTTTGTVTSSSNASITFSLQAAPNAYVLTADKGTYSFTGNAATLARAVVLASSSGNFIESGNAASLSRGFGLTSSTGAFNEDGNNAALLAGRIVTGSTGVFSFTGNAATFTKTTASKTLLADVGAFTSTGNDAAFGLARKVSASPGNFALVGNNATLGNTYAIQCSPNAFAVTGSDARLFKTRRRLINF
jgi:hypothetical protein